MVHIRKIWNGPHQENLEWPTSGNFVLALILKVVFVIFFKGSLFSNNSRTEGGSPLMEFYFFQYVKWRDKV